MKEIEMITINKLKKYELNIFEAEDDDVPNYRKIRRNEREIEKLIKRYSDEEINELLRLVKWTNDNCVETLEQNGWIVHRRIKIGGKQ